jgi:hypothetical protein
VGRNDVARVWLTDLGTDEEEGRAELFDDGTHGDLQAGDNIFTLGDVQILCTVSGFMEFGWRYSNHFLRVELTDGQYLGNNYGLMIGHVDPAYKNGFEVVELAPGLTATAYALFIEDAGYEVLDGYPVANVYCGTSNYVGYQQLYSVLPDIFDIAMVQPGMPIYRPSDLAENVPYNVLVSNQVQNIGVDIFDDTALFGSAGVLKSAIFMSFSSIAVFDHEIGHTWGPAIGQSLELYGPRYNYDFNQGHWNEFADIEGQMGSYYFDDSGAVGHFSYQGDDTWQLIPNIIPEPFSPLELYVMGLIPPEEVPPIHILTDPDTSNLESITAASVQTITIEDIIAAEGGERIPSAADSQKNFRLAFIVTQDVPFNDAAYAYFSLMSYQLTSQDPPSDSRPSLAPFYWATGGRATLETLLPLELSVPILPGELQAVEEDPADASEEETQPTVAAPNDAAEEQEEGVVEDPPTAEETTNQEQSPGCSMLPVGLIALPGLLARRRKSKVR